MQTNANIVAVILAGGQGRRLGGVTKAMLELRGATLLARVHAALAPQAETILLSIAAHQIDAPWVLQSHLPAVTDPVDGCGPLGGVAAALAWARAHAPEATAVVSTPVDVPFLPPDLVKRLLAEEAVAVAQSGTQAHHAIAAWPISVAHDVFAALGKGEFAIHAWESRHGVRYVSWPAEPYDPFLNINTADDLRAAERVAAMDRSLT